MLVVARTQSLVAAAALTLIGVGAARHAATKAAIATLGVLSLAQVPWIASPFIAGCVWLPLAHRHRILAHIIADLIIFTAVLPLVLFTGWAT